MTEIEEILLKLQKYCAGRERCTAEVMKKIALLNVDEDIAKALIIRLKEHNFLDDRRFCVDFVRKAFEEKQQGRIRILEELKIWEISEDLIEEALKEISKEDFSNLLLVKIKKETRKMNPEEISLNAGRIMRKMVRDGFEQEEIAAIFRKFFSIDI